MENMLYSSIKSVLQLVCVYYEMKIPGDQLYFKCQSNSVWLIVSRNQLTSREKWEITFIANYKRIEVVDIHQNAVT